MTDNDTYTVDVGDDASQIAAGSGNYQRKTDNHADQIITINLNGELDKYASTTEPESIGKGVMDKYDWLTITITVVFFVLNLVTGILPVIFRTTQQDGLQLYSGALSSITALMGVLVGHRISVRYRR